MKTALIFGGAPCDAKMQPRPSKADLIVCADAGIKLAQEMGIVPDQIIGDFDSWQGELPEEMTQRYPVEKDDTDMLLAVKYALSQECRKIDIYGGLGGRLDHFLANVQVLRFLQQHGAEGVLLDEKHCITLQCGGSRRYPKRDGYFSLLCAGTVCRNVTISGTKYLLQNGDLHNFYPLGISNEIVEEYATVTIGEGELLVMYVKE